MFNIGFFDADNRKTASESTSVQADQNDSFVCLGRITIGSFVERFECVLDYWRKEDCEVHWCAALSRLVAGSDRTALITSISNPASANFFTWWPFYRENQTAFVQNQMLFLDLLAAPLQL